MNHVITVYPVAAEYKTALEQVAGPIRQYYTISDLRHLTVSRLIKTLWNIKGNLYLFVEQPEHAHLIPILHLISLLTSSRHVFIVDTAIKPKKVSFLMIVKSVFSVWTGTLAGIYALIRCWLELKYLTIAKVVPKQKIVDKNLYYLKTNLWFGIKAGGSVGHIAGVINAFHKNKWHVNYYSVETPVMLNKNIAVHNLSRPSSFAFPAELNLYSFHRCFARQLYSQLANIKTGYIYQRMSLGNYCGVSLSRNMSLPLIVEYNGSEVWVSKNWGSRLLFEKSAQMAEEVMLKHADLVVTISAPLKAELIEKGITESRIILYPNCIDPDIFCPELFNQNDKNRLRKHFGLDPEHKIVTFIGTFGIWHGVDILADAIITMINNHRDWLDAQKVHFMLIGDGVSMPDVAAKLAPTEYQQYCTLTGIVPQHEAPGLLAIADIFVSPHVRNRDGSEFFGSPTKLFEYMAMGKPVIASNLGQLGELLAGSPNLSELENNASYYINSESARALLVEPGDQDELVRAVKYLINNQEMGRQLADNARSYVLSHFTWDNHVQKILDAMPLLDS